MLEGLDINQPVCSTFSSDEESDDMDSKRQLEEEIGILRTLAVGDTTALETAYKVFDSMEKHGKAGKLGIAAHLRSRRKD